ncbi:FHA domain-containing protein [Naasia sp. SYSU D00057]|uniref:FHA domain-containing protein n=1 Tax=Naasia sp. SYSU D00057 TaxID=2817380 RepID=UPI001B315E5F|nr:FHA domain-containing protein [Naasia sp. SYSU D00057]
MTATPLTLDEGTDVRPVTPVAEAQEVLPSRRRQRETERSGGAEDRIPALAALDSATEFVLVVRDGDTLRVFSEGGLVAQDSDGVTIEAGIAGREVEAPLPLRVASPAAIEDESAAAAQETTVPVAPAEVETTEEDAEDLFESLLEFGETSRVPGFVRGSILPEEPLDENEDEAEELDPAESPEAYLSLAIVLPDGRRVAADHTVLLGRSPSARADDPEAEAIALDSSLTDISRNHLELRAEGDSVFARDLDSTNGTVLTRRGQQPRLIPTDEALRVLPGDSLNLGGSATIEIEGLR